MNLLRRYFWIILSIVAVAAFFYQTVFFGKLPAPTDDLVGLYHPWRDVYSPSYPRGVPYKNFLITDPIRQQIPWKSVVMSAWKNGSLPGWNPYSGAGVPLNANIQAQPFYPFTILFSFLQFPVAWSILVILQPLLSMIFFYMFVRRHGVSPYAASIGGLLYAFCGFSIAWMTWGTITQTALWIPCLLFCIDAGIEQYAKKQGYISAIATLFVGYALVTAGHMQVAFYGGMLSLVYAIWRLRAKPHAFYSSGVRLGLVAFGIVVLTSFQWLPFVRYSVITGRLASLDVWKTEGWFLPFAHLIQEIVPDYFGNPATLNYWGTWNYGEMVGYISILGLLFASQALFRPGLSRFFSFLLIGSLLVAVDSPIARIPYMLHIPGFSVLQPTRILVLFDLSVAVLAANGIDIVFQEKRIRWGWVVGVIGVFLLSVVSLRFLSAEHMLIAKRNVLYSGIVVGTSTVVLFLSTRRYGKFKGAVLLVVFLVLLADLFRFGWKFTPFTPAEYFFPKTSKTLTYLQRQKKPFRVMSLDDRILPPNTNAYYSVESVDLYDPITSQRYQTFLEAVSVNHPLESERSAAQRIYTVRNIDSILLPYLNVKYVLSPAPISRPFLSEVMNEGMVAVYEYTRFVPRVYIAPTVVTVNRSLDALNTLFSFPVGTVAVTEQAVSILSVPLSDSEGTRLIHYSDNILRFEVTAVNPRIVVILTSFDPGWRATIDGKSAVLIRANYLFSAIVVPEGTHEVQLIYR